MTSNHTSLQDQISQQSEFVGRDDQVALFRRNLALPSDKRFKIFNAFGQGGVGKSTLLRRLREIAEANGALAALADDHQTDVLATMEQIAGELARQGHELRAFTERYRTYRQRRRELESEPAAPTGLSSLFARTLITQDRSLAGALPINDALVALAADSTVDQWIEYIARKLHNDVETILLLRKPVEELTRLWLADLNTVAEKAPIILFFDTYERTGPFLDAWLRDLLGGVYGQLPDQAQLVVAGRNELDHTAWLEHESRIARRLLEPFTEQEAYDFLVRNGVTSAAVIKAIVRLSGRLPLLVATLATKRPNGPAMVENPRGTAVEHFLIWIEDPVLRRAAVDAALPRHFNRGIVSLLVDEHQIDSVFSWLRRLPFVEQHADGWAYHPAVREQMLRYKQGGSKRGWQALHARLAEYYHQECVQLQLPEEISRWNDRAWYTLRSEAIYHQLCRSYDHALTVALNDALAALDASHEAISQYAGAFTQAEADADIAEARRWGRRIQMALDAYNADQYAALVTLLGDLLQRTDIAPASRDIALGWRALALRCLGRHQEALADLDAALAQAPERVALVAERGETYCAIARYEEALADFTRVIELEPQSIWMVERRVQLFRQLERHEEMFADLTYLIKLEPHAPQRYLQRAEAYQDLERYEEMFADMARVIELEPHNTWRYLQRGNIYRELERYEEALADFSHLSDLAPPEARWLVQRGDIYQKLGRYEDMLADLTRAVEIEPPAAWAFMQRAEAYRELGRNQEALADFTRAVELDTGDGWALRQRSQFYRSLERYEDMFADLTHAIERAPQSAWRIAQRGEAYGNLGRYEEALADFMRAIELEPQDTWAISYRGYLYQQLKRYEEALVDLTYIIDRDPTDAWALAHRGAVYAELDRNEEALVDLNRAIELNPENTWAITYRGYVYRQLKRYDEALVDLAHTIAREPNNAWALSHRGATYRQFKRYDEALADHARAIELEPNNAWALSHRGETYRKLQRYDKALADLNRAIEINPQETWAIGRRALAYRQLQRYDEALADFTRRVELDPKNDWAIAQRGEIYRQLQRYDEALADFTRAIEIDPNYGWAIGSRGQVYRRLQRNEEAWADYTRAIELNDSDWRRYERALIHLQWQDRAAATIDLTRALQQARQKYEQSPTDWNNAFNLALYLLASGDAIASRQRYRELALAAPVAASRVALGDLDDYLASFADNADALAIRAELRAESERRQGEG